MPGPSGPSPRMIGLTIASLMFITFAIIIWQSMGKGVSNTPTNQDNLFPDDPSEIPDLNDLEQGARMLVTIVDRDDPTRIAGTLEADQFEPMGGGQRRLVNPDGWIYMRDGRRVHITADHGVVMMPDPNEAPDSGTLEGNVTIHSFDPQTTDPVSSAMGISNSADQTPAMTAVFDQPVEFERRYHRLTSDGRFTIDSAGLSFIGHDLTVMLNEVKGRVELIDVRKGERLILRPDAQKATQVTQAPQKPYQLSTVMYPSIALQDVAQVPVQQEQPKEQPYHIEIKEQVLVDLIGSGSLRADTLDVWAMLIDGALSADAVKQIRFAQTDNQTGSQTSSQTEQPQVTSSNATAQQSISQSNGAAAASEQPKDGEVVVTWDGPLVVRPIEDASKTVLESEQLALSFSSQDRVEFESATQGFSGSVDSLTYGATSAELSLIGTESQPVQLIADQAGTLHAQQLTSNLESGMITINSPGRLESIQATDEPRAQIDWNESAQFELAKLDSGELTGRLKSAAFQGSVLGTRADAVMRTQTLFAQLDEDGPIESALQSIELSMGTLQSDSGSLTADEIAIGFTPSFDGSSVDPVSLNASGAVLAISQDGRVETKKLDASLFSDLDGSTRVKRAVAIGDTKFLGENQTTASGHRVDLNTDQDTIQITSSDSSTKASAGQAGSLIHGDDILINTRSRSILVEGPGSFDHDIASEGGSTGFGSDLAGGHLRVTWEESMRFDDALGSIECSGDVVAVSTPDAYTLDTLKADRLEIDLTPAPSTRQNANPGVVAESQPERELIEARAFGRAVPGGDAIPASVESRTYDPANPERAVGVMYLEGTQLVADNRSQVLKVPTSGLLVLMDRTEDQPGGQSPESTSVMPNTSGPGLTRMTWLGSMDLDRASGNAMVLNEVNIRHKSLTTGRVSQLGCDQLFASFTGSQSGNPSAPITMHAAEANGRVRFTDLQRTLLSDHAIYDAAAETMFAFADDDRLVTLRDTTDPTPISAKTLLWDLRRDLVEIDAPSPVRAPSRP
jgi:hypothetical protein